MNCEVSQSLLCVSCDLPHPLRVQEQFVVSVHCERSCVGYCMSMWRVLVVCRVEIQMRECRNSYDLIVQVYILIQLYSCLTVVTAVVYTDYCIVYM